jgi:hypothetical protein
MEESSYFMANAILSVVAQLLNTVFSTISLFTRPVASLAYALFGDCCDEEPKKAFHRQPVHRYADEKPLTYPYRVEVVDSEYRFSSASSSYR